MAREILSAILEAEPRNEQAYIWSAAVAETPEESIRLLERLIEINPNNAMAWKTLAAHRLARTPAPAKVPLVQPTAVLSPSMSPTTAGDPSVAALIPPAATPAPAPPRPKCLVCSHQQEEAESRSVCSHCGCALSLAHLTTAVAKGTVNERRVEEAIAELSNRPATDAAAALGIGLGYVSLHRSGDALPHLRRAWNGGCRDERLKDLCAEISARKLVLIVDDSPTVRRLVATALERNGLRVRSGVNGREGFIKFQEETPEFVLTDITMPEMDGYEFCKAVRRHPAGKGLPVVMLSGNDGLFDKVRGKVAGATDHLNKPFHNDVLMAAVTKYLRKPEASRGFRLFSM